MRPSEPARVLPDTLDDDYVDELRAIAAAHGVTRTGVAAAEVLERARVELFRRRDAGLHDGMQFTYKNPDRSTDPQQAVRGARAVFVGARPYLLDASTRTRTELASDAVPAAVARYAWTDHYAPLREGLWAVVRKLRADGWKAVAYADDNSMVDREIAYRAGLGWFGKNANLLLDGAGSFFVLGSVVTTAPLPVTAEPAGDGCGTCRRCLDGCPTGAIVEPGVVDAARCLAWLLQKPGWFPREYRVALGDRIYGCDECQEVCPPTVRLGARHAAADVPVSARVEPVIDALALLEADDATVLHRWGRWYLSDRDPRWHRRNALVVIGNAGNAGNVGDAGNAGSVGDARPAARARVTAVLSRYLAHDDPLLRGHAVWAARRLGRDDLVPLDDPDPDVRAELIAPL